MLLGVALGVVKVVAKLLLLQKKPPQEASKSPEPPKLAMKNYLGELIPVFDIFSFSAAFNMAVDQYGSSKEQKFWWYGNVYTTEKR